MNFVPFFGFLSLLEELVIFWKVIVKEERFARLMIPNLDEKILLAFYLPYTTKSLKSLLFTNYLWV